MRRFVRILVDAAAAASLLLAVATAALWARSYAVADEAYGRAEGVAGGAAVRSAWRAFSAAGTLAVYRVAGETGDPAWAAAGQRPVRERGWNTSADPAGVRRRWTGPGPLGFRFERIARDVMAYARTPAGARVQFVGRGWVAAVPTGRWSSCCPRCRRRDWPRSCGGGGRPASAGAQRAGTTCGPLQTAARSAAPPPRVKVRVTTRTAHALQPSQ